MNLRNKSFTLIEVLLALFITAILIAILSVVFNTGLRAYRQGKDLLEITRKGQLILGQMTKELAGAMVQKDYIPFKGDNVSVFFMAPVENSSDLDLCEIGYKLDGDVFTRHFLTYDPSDAAKKFEYPSTVDFGELNLYTFCERISNFNLIYCDEATSHETSWNSTEKLPTMVEVTVTIQGEYPKNAPVQFKTFTTWIYLPNSTDNP